MCYALTQDVLSQNNGSRIYAVASKEDAHCAGFKDDVLWSNKKFLNKDSKDKDRGIYTNCLEDW